ncbi:polysaccharide biosynthesis protein [Tepidibacillus fermentans]|uniref:FlaA1/EpsC-like NDP-sugar epimerase n=1 Tax=Tepidibacillus fermentans TaxID=1281767 RepID=A0A4R3KKS4_9BACI|nr:nucleoside-diphosphate sugar epimerase/dehydratase [Tepidibacillus fermentans]TCS83353.1 FlaA1/EpsC-like NDP-sugar epimerase [Tepidibacillus fermentans]
MNSKQKRRIILIFIDVALISLSVLWAYLLRFEYSIPSFYWKFVPYAALSYAILTVLVYHWYHLYKKVWAYVSVGELYTLIKANVISTAVLLIINHFVQESIETNIIPRSIFLISFFIMTIAIGGSRLAWRLFHDRFFLGDLKQGDRRTLVVGAGDAGALVIKELRNTTHFYPVAMIDDDPEKLGLEILGVPIVGNRNDIPKIVKQLRVQDIIIAMPSASKQELRKIIDICKTTGAQVKILPASVKDILEGKLSVKIRDVDVEDLLGRDPVKVDLEEISDYLKDRVVLVTGAGGSIGSELSRQIARFHPKQLVLLGHGENSIYGIDMELRNQYPELQIEPIIADIQDKSRVERIFREFRPEVVFHAAAHKHVPLMEKNPSEAIKNNVFGTKNIAEAAHDFGAERFVLISTDKAVNPTSVMGTTKRIAEMFIQALDKVSPTKFVAVRFGNVLGSRGSVIPLFKKQIEQGGPVTVTHPEMVRFFMTIPEAVQLVIQAGAMAKGGEIFILDMGNPVKIVDLAKDLIRLSGLKVDEDIKIKYTGIRPGEKLYEEILTQEEGTTKTKHQRIFIAKPTEIDYTEFNQEIQKLTVVLDKDEHEIKQALKDLVPTFQYKGKENVEGKSEPLKV